MIKKVFGSQVVWILVMLGVVISCEQEDNLVGYNIVGDNAANLEKAYVTLSTHNILADTVRSDRYMQTNATIGVFNDPVFGMAKSSYYSQVRLGTLNPKFDDNARVDSVVLSLPVYAITKDTVSYSRKLTNTLYTLSKKDNNCSIQDTLTQYLRSVTYKMDSLYGNDKANMTLRVHQVTENMGTIDSVYYSNKTFKTGALFGSKLINNEVLRNTLVQYRTSVAKDSTIVSEDKSPSIKLKLDGMRDFVQNHIVDQQGSSNLSDQISFISNVLQGIKIDVAENDGFIFNISPSDLKLTAYISSKNEAFTDQNGNGIDDSDEACGVSVIKPRKTETFELIVGSSLSNQSSKYYNVSQNAIAHTNGSMQSGANMNTAYLQGMGGAKLKLSLDPSQIEMIRDNVKNKGWVVNEAHIKVFPATSTQNGLALPKYLNMYNATNKTVLPDYGANPTSSNPSDLQTGFPYQQISLPYNSEKGFYLLRCTQFIKNMVEKNESIDDLMLEMGNYVGLSPQELFDRPTSPFNTDRLYNPYRLAIFGSNPNDADTAKKLQLEIYYSTKN
ncbi:MAG: DUF4270 family protein [Weeksellaceae bacterium]